jgi:hypothetical protein
MSVTEVLQGLGGWSLTLSADTPQDVLDQLDLFGHVAIHAGSMDPRVARDALLMDSRYVGVYRGRGNQPVDAGVQYTLNGPGMAFWLGDEEGKGHALETPLTLNTTFAAWVAALLPPSVIAGTIVAVPKNFNYTFQYVTPREALNYMCGTLECAWRINGNASVDAGLESDLFTVVPEAALVRKGPGVDMFMKALAGSMSTEIDMSDFTTRVVLLANGAEAATVTATADIAPVKNPYKDLFGNAVVLKRFISESDTDATNAPARAQLQQNRFSDAKRAISLSSSDYDLKGDVAVGDYMWVFDPEIGVVDITNTVNFRGEVLYPMKLRLTEMTWPITEEMGVAFRDMDGNWIDLTPYVVPESGDSQLVVGGFYKALGDGDGGSVGSRPIADTSVPGVPTWVTPFVHSVYQSQNGESRAQVQLKWLRPNNVDGSSILDGSHFEIRYRSSSSPIFPSTHVQMSAFTHVQLAGGTHNQPINYVPGPYRYATVPWDQLTLLLDDLPTNMPFEAEVRAVDSAKPANAGGWSTVTVFQTSGDTLAPATPAPPSIAAGRMNVQMTHTLGRSDGGVYNLDADLHHFELHGEYEPLFTPSSSTLLGKVPANVGMIKAQVPAVGSVPIESTLPVYFKVIAVDNDGNKSPASTAVQSTALLVDDAHISSLTVSKITAGTITASWINAGIIWSGTAGGARTQQSYLGFEAFNASNQRTFFVEAASGNVTITGKFQTGTSGDRVVIDPLSPLALGGTTPAIAFYNGSNPQYGRLRYSSNIVNLSSLNTTDHTSEGGYLQFDMPGIGNGSAYLGFYSTSTGAWAYHQVGSSGDHHFRGRIATNGGSASNNAAIMAGEVTGYGAGGFSSFINYPFTMMSNPCVVATVNTSNGTLFRWHTSNRASNGFWINIEGGAAAPVDVFYWCYRI